MDTFRHLSQQRVRIVEQIAALGPMRMGSVCAHYVPSKRKDGSAYRRGPYPTYTFKRGGKTCGKQLRDEGQAAVYRQQIAAFRRYQELSSELVEVSQRLADLEVSDQGKGKKNSRR